MTDLVCLHPAPVRFVPARAREERASLARIGTPVRLRRAARDGFEPVRIPDRGNHTGSPTEGVLRDAEGLWAPMRRLVGGNLVPAVSTDDLVAYLAGDAPAAGLGDAFRGTPVAAPVAERDLPRRRRNPHYMDPAVRGNLIDLDGARSVRVDGRERAARGLAAFLDRDVRIVADGKGGERAYKRFAPVLAMVVTPGLGLSGHLWRVPYALNVGSINGMICQPDGAEALVRLAGELGLPTRGDGGAALLAGAVGPGDWSDDVLGKVANVHAQEVWRTFALAYADMPEGHPGNAALRPLALRLMDMAAFSAIGLAQGDDARQALRDLADGIRESGATAVPRTGPYVLEAALNRIHLVAPRPEPAAEDVEALAGLVPGR